MARKPNYRFARLERERNKAARKAARANLKAERAELRRQEKDGPSTDGAAAGDVVEAADPAAESLNDTAPAADNGLQTDAETSQPDDQ